MKMRIRRQWLCVAAFVAAGLLRDGSAFAAQQASRPSILTGRNTWQLKEAVSHNGLFPSGFETYPDLLEKAGYFVGLTGKGWGPGDFRTAAKRTRNPAGPSFDKLTQQVPASGISPQDYAGNFDGFLKARPKDKPFCFWMGFHEPHRA